MAPCGAEEGIHIQESEPHLGSHIQFDTEAEFLGSFLLLQITSKPWSPS